ncbi:Thaumatin-like protein 1 [Nymphaea thermarum]|nr:Thaumatin-like protein 1 [Nymphaea thermarum]
MESVHSATLTFKNNCPFTVWPGTLASGGSPALSATGFKLAQGTTMTLDAPPSWSGRFWARTQCSADSSGKFKCVTGDCGSGSVACSGAGAVPPVTLVEFTFGSGGAQDFYDVSCVDGFNLPVSVAPSSGTIRCSAAACPVDIKSSCPPELKVVGPHGATVACKSACLAFSTPEYCCTGAHSTPETCPPTQYSKFFKQQCPQAYSYAYDDKSSTFTCIGANYAITFCP